MQLGAYEIISLVGAGGMGDVYVQPFPADGNRHQVSKEGGTHPVWRPDGKELFFLRFADRMLMSVPIPATTQWNPGTPQALFISGAQRSLPSQQYAATPGFDRGAADRRRQLARGGSEITRLPHLPYGWTFSNFTSPGKNGTVTR